MLINKVSCVFCGPLFYNHPSPQRQNLAEHNLVRTKLTGEKQTLQRSVFQQILQNENPSGISLTYLRGCCLLTERQLQDCFLDWLRGVPAAPAASTDEIIMGRKT